MQDEYERLKAQKDAILKKLEEKTLAPYKQQLAAAEAALKAVEELAGKIEFTHDFFFTVRGRECFMYLIGVELGFECAAAIVKKWREGKK